MRSRRISVALYGSLACLALILFPGGVDRPNPMMTLPPVLFNLPPLVTPLSSEGTLAARLDVVARDNASVSAEVTFWSNGVSIRVPNADFRIYDTRPNRFGAGGVTYHAIHSLVWLARPSMKAGDWELARQVGVLSPHFRSTKPGNEVFHFNVPSQITLVPAQHQDLVTPSHATKSRKWLFVPAGESAAYQDANTGRWGISVDFEVQPQLSAAPAASAPADPPVSSELTNALAKIDLNAARERLAELKKQVAVAPTTLHGN